MRKLILGILIASSSAIYAQGDLSPAIIRNIEMFFNDNFVDYTRITNIDPSTSPVDTFVVVDIQKGVNGNYLNGREWDDPTIPYATWYCSMNGQVNEVRIVDNFVGDTVQLEKIYRDAQNRDTLYEVYADTGTGNLVLVQNFQLYYGSLGIDSAYTGIPGQGAFGEVDYYFYRQANGNLDSILAAITFAGTSFPVQTLRYYYGSSGIDSIDIVNNLSGEIEGQFRVQYSGTAISQFSFFEKDINDEWVAFDTYIFSDENFFSLPEAARNANSNISLFPNPSSRFLNVEAISNSSFEIINSQGQIVMSGALENKDQVSLEGLDAGVYIIRLESDKGLIGEKRFVKN